MEFVYINISYTEISLTIKFSRKSTGMVSIQLVVYLYTRLSEAE
jgi:hypothetical protein